MRFHLSCILFFLPCIIRGDEEECYYGQYKAECSKDGSGYTAQSCTSTLIGDHYVSKFEVVDTGKCPADGSVCKCEEDFSGDSEYWECKCVSKRTPPAFPAAGIIRWNGTWSYDEDYGDEDVEIVMLYTPGEVHKDTRGRYFVKRTVVVEPAWWQRKDPYVKVEFEIIVPNPNGKTFTKYSGKEGCTTCEKEEVTATGVLSSIWEKPEYKASEFKKETKKSEDSRTEEWASDVAGMYTKHDWKWIVEYNTESNHAVPIEYKYDFIDYDEWAKKNTRLKYSYEAIGDGVDSFRLEDYCSNL